MQHYPAQLQKAINRFRKLSEPKVQREFVTQKQYAATVIAAVLAILAIFVRRNHSLQFIYAKVKAYFKAFYKKLDNRASINVNFAKNFFNTADIIVQTLVSYFYETKNKAQSIRVLFVDKDHQVYRTILSTDKLKTLKSGEIILPKNYFSIKYFKAILPEFQWKDYPEYPSK